MNAELDRLRAEVASLKEERDEHEKHDAARDEKIRILTTYHGLGCACSYDSVDDVCEHHSPKLMALTQQLAAANGRVEMLQKALEYGKRYEAAFTEGVPRPLHEALAALQSQSPEEWKLVPVEPTNAMVEAKLDIDPDALAPGYAAHAIGVGKLPCGYHASEQEAIDAGIAWLRAKAVAPNAELKGGASRRPD
jgi:hypothetical protein